MKAEIHFNNKEILECNEVDITCSDYGLTLEGKDERVFVPYSNIMFVREFKKE